MKPILEIQQISKKFKINNEQEPYLSLRDSISTIFKQKTTTEDFWALQDITFSVNKGDTIGIIGKNGAGKSTLLKILSRITPPTSGKIICRGRIASLLEVGTGFHSELNGRENVLMNGSILGMRKAEILKKFDAIVDFAGVEKFIDTPLKHYSSGMQLRLAFAVAAFLEPEILIIDEVLAVGDAEFQKKCLGKMKDVAQDGRTILFVSHDIESVSVLCNKAVLLNNGLVKTIGTTDEVIKEYTNHYQESFKTWDINNRPGDNLVKLNSVRLINKEHLQIFQPKINEVFGVEIEFEVFENNCSPTPNYHFYTSTNICCFVAIAETKELIKGIYKSVIWVPENLLNNQTYKVGIALTSLKNVDIHLYEKDIINIDIIENKIIRNTEYGGNIPGTVRPILISETYLAI